MPKTGWKFTKTTPAKGSTNMLKKSNASSRPGRTAPKKGDSNMRTSDTIKRLKMYNNGKAIRNKEGTIVGGQFMMSDRAGDSEINACKFFYLIFKNANVVALRRLSHNACPSSMKLLEEFSLIEGGLETPELSGRQSSTNSVKK